MAESFTKGISRIFCSSFQYIHRQPSLFNPYLGINGRSLWKNFVVQQRNKGAVTGSSGRKGVVDNCGLIGTLQLGKVGKKHKIKGKLYKEKGVSKQDYDIFSTSSKLKKPKLVKITTTPASKNRSYGSFMSSLNRSSQTDKLSLAARKAFGKQNVTQKTQTTHLPKQIRSSKEHTGFNRWKNSALSNSGDLIYNKVPVGTISTKNAVLSGKGVNKKQKAWNKRKEKAKHKLDSVGDMKWFPNQASMSNNEFLGLDRLDLDLTGSQQSVDATNNQWQDNRMKMNKQFEILPVDFKMEEMFGTKRKSKNKDKKNVRSHGIENESDLIHWSSNSPITGYDDLLTNERRAKSAEKRTSFNKKTKQKKSQNMLSNKTSELENSSRNVSEESILTNNTKQGKGSSPQKLQLVPTQQLHEIMKGIETDSFQKNVDSLIETLKTDDWQSEVEQKLEAAMKAQKNARLLKNNQSTAKRIGEKKIKNTIVSLSQTISTVPKNTSRVKVSELIPDVVKTGQSSPTKNTKQRKQNVGIAQSSVSGPVLVVSPDEIISNKKSRNTNVAHYINLDKPVNSLSTVLKSNFLIPMENNTASVPAVLTRKGFSNTLASSQTQKTIPEIWSSSQKLQELKRKKQDNSCKNDRTCLSSESCNAYKKLNNKETELSRELKETYKDLFRQRFQQMLHDQKMRERLGTLPTNTLVYTPNSQAKWISDQVESAKNKIETETKSNKKQKKKMKKKMMKSKFGNGIEQHDKKILKDPMSNTPWRESGVRSDDNIIPNDESSSRTETTSDKKIEDFITRRDVQYHQETLSLAVDHPRNRGSDLAHGLRNLDGLVTMVAERVYDTPAEKNIHKAAVEKSNNQKVFERLVMERYKQALRRYQERQQKEKEEKNRKRKNSNNSSNNSKKKLNVIEGSKGKTQRGSSSRHNIEN